MDTLAEKIKMIKEKTKQDKRTVYILLGVVGTLVVILLGTLLFNTFFGDQTDKYIESKEIVAFQMKKLVTDIQYESNTDKRSEKVLNASQEMKKEIYKVNCGRVKGAKKLECEGLQSDISNFVKYSEEIKKAGNAKVSEHPELKSLLDNYEATLMSLKSTLDLR